MIANEACSAELAIIISYPTSASGIIVLLKNKHQEILLDLADFALQEQPEDMVAKPIKSLELHHTNVQFLLSIHIVYCSGFVLIALFHAQTTTFLIFFSSFFFIY